MKTAMTYEEDLFCLLAADRRIADSWYAARQYVLANLPQWEKQSPSHHYAIHGSSDMLLSVARQIALVSHYTGSVSVLDFVGVKDAGALVERLAREEFLNNLARYCKVSVIRGPSERSGGTAKLPKLDIEIRIHEGCECNDEADCIRIDDNAVDDYLTVAGIRRSIDVRKARWVNAVYSIGSTLDNLPPDDPNTAARYSYALDILCHHTTGKKLDDGWKGITDVRRKLSNVFCADCFESHARDMSPDYRESLAALAECEHARWNVEKLIMGFRPLSDEERYHDEVLFGRDRREYRKMLQNRTADPAHIDLCSYADLKRVNPEDMKYDSFLMLAIPHILRSCSD